MMAHQAKIRMVAKDPAEKLARQRLNVLQLAQALGSISAACRRVGDGPHQLLRLEAALPDAQAGGAEGPAAGAPRRPRWWSGCWRCRRPTRPPGRPPGRRCVAVGSAASCG
jgi:hypothetical protein